MARERRRKDRVGRARSVTSAAPLRPSAPPRPPWRWRTFPVYCTFSATLFLTALVTSIVDGAHGVNIIEALGALAFSIALAHVVVSRLIEPRVSRRLDRGPRQDHEP